MERHQTRRTSRCSAVSRSGRTLPPERDRSWSEFSPPQRTSPDVLLCRGEYQIQPPLPFTPGVELCGEVISIGDAVTKFAIGDRVIGTPTLPLGGFAELSLLDQDDAYLAPPSLDDAEASTLSIGIPDELVCPAPSHPLTAW